MPANYVLDAACQLAYLFDEGSGTSVRDLSGNVRTGVFNSDGHPAWVADAPIYAVRGQGLGAVSFEATSPNSDILSYATSDLLLPFDGAWSLTCWLKPTIDTIGGGGAPRVAQRGSVPFSLGSPKNIVLDIAGTTNLQLFSNDNSFVFNVWQHFAWTGDGSLTALNYHIYLNGVEVGYKTTQDGNTLTSNSGATLTLGNSVAGDRSTGGSMTDIAIFNRQLSAAEILDIYNYGLLLRQFRPNHLRPAVFSPGFAR
jgi:hypothetical protein